MIDTNDERLHLMIGNFPYFVGAQTYIGAAKFIYGLIAVASQSIYLWYYWKGIKPTYLRPFLMISGMTSPESIGITDVLTVEKLMKRAKLNFKITKLILKTRIPVAILTAGVPLSMNSNIIEFFCFVIPWVSLFTLWVNTTAGYLLHQINYFSIICYYLKLKLKVLNTRFEAQIKSTKRLTITDVRKFIRNYDFIHREIHEFNNNHWSLYLAILVGSVMIMLDLLLYFSIFLVLNPIVKILFFYIVFIFLSFLVLLLMTASTVGREANRTHTILNNLLNRKRCLLRLSPTSFKVYSRYIC